MIEASALANFAEGVNILQLNKQVTTMLQMAKELKGEGGNGIKELLPLLTLLLSEKKFEKVWHMLAFLAMGDFSRTKSMDPRKYHGEKKLRVKRMAFGIFINSYKNSFKRDLNLRGGSHHFIQYRC